MKLRRLSTASAGFDAELAALTRYEAAQDEAVESATRAIIADVRKRGDAAVLEATRKFCGIQGTILQRPGITQSARRRYASRKPWASHCANAPRRSRIPA